VLPNLGWRWLLAFSSLPIIVVSLLGLLLLVESPRFEVVRGRHRRAHSTLDRMARYNNKPKLNGRLTALDVSAQPTTLVKHSRKSRCCCAATQCDCTALRVLLSKTYRRDTLLLWLIWLTVGLIGRVLITYFLPTTKQTNTPQQCSFAYYGLVLFTSDYFALIGSEDVLINSLITAGFFLFQNER
jgi:MFS family permease